MRNRAELERANHVKHRFDHLLPEGVVQRSSHLHWASLGENRKDYAQLLHRSNPQHASLSHRSCRLICVGHLIATAQNKHAVVADIDKVDQEAVD